MCGLLGIHSNKLDLSLIYYGMKAIQHRGQEAAGLVYFIDTPLTVISNIFKVEGSVDKLFEHIKTGVKENKAASYCNVLGHTRYSTAGAKNTNNYNNIHPFIIHGLKGSLSLIHNGNVTNAQELKTLVDKYNLETQGNTDSELILLLINYYWNKKSANTLEDSIYKVVSLCKGSLNLILGMQDEMYVYRDPSGNRPLVEGFYTSENSEFNNYIIASESSVLDTIEATYIGEIAAGCLIRYIKGTREVLFSIAKKERRCIFEDIYFSRADSIVDNKSLHEYRSNLGKILALKNKDLIADYVVGVPDSGITAAISYAHTLNLPYINGFVKNRYIGRTFIQPTQKMRREGVKAKLNVVPNILKDKEIILIDDSIVRGNTSKFIISNLRKAGVKKIHLRLTSPPIINPCNLGMDFPLSEELIAASKSIEEIAEYIDVDSIMYLTVEDLIEATVSKNPSLYCTGCFNGRFLD
jgi:amidophosphoribosyltransferase